MKPIKQTFPIQVGLPPAEKNIFREVLTMEDPSATRKLGKLTRLRDLHPERILT